jgi:chemotaxis protein CheD
MSATPGGNVHFLHPGDVVCARRGDRLETLLGSCISVILTDSERAVATMCHIVHADRDGAQDPSRTTGTHAAIDAMYGLLSSQGIEPALCEAFVHGGGNMFPELVSGAHVGVNNAHSVMDRLASDGIKVIAQDIGGNAYRRLSWTVGDGSPQINAVEVVGR